MKGVIFFMVATFISFGLTASFQEVSEDDICYGLHVNKLYCTCKPTDVDVRGIDCFVLSDFPATDPLWRAFHPLTKLERISLFSQQEGILTYVPVETLRHSVDVIETFEIKYGAIQNIPAYTFLNSTSVLVIDLANNGIETLSRHGFSYLSALKELHLSENELTIVKRDTFVALPRLSLLLLDRNRIRTIEDSTFAELVSLQELTLMKNELRLLSPGMFDGLGSLKRLELGMNKIIRLENGVFSKLTQVQEINLRENHLTIIEPDAFRGLSNLMNLYLNRNQLVRIEDNTFRRLLSLRYLDLRFNSLTTLSENAVSSLRLRQTNSSQVYLTENKFECDCRIKWMLEMAKLKKYDELNQWKLVECKPPPASEMEQIIEVKKGIRRPIGNSNKGSRDDIIDQVANDRPSLMGDSDRIPLEDAVSYIESKTNCLVETKLKMKSSSPSSSSSSVVQNQVYSVNTSNVLLVNFSTIGLSLLMFALFDYFNK